MNSCIGHNDIKDKLRKNIKDSKIAHAYLFVGKKSIGKKLVATEFAQNILCNNPIEGKACGNCIPCKTFSNTSDFKIIEPDKGVIKVDDIRNLSNEIFLKPTVSSRKVFIIDDADAMNEQAQNALLKILEEPPLYMVLILVATNKEKLLNTIKSRVLEINFEALSSENLKKILEIKGIEYTEEAIEFANGSVNRAIDFMSDDTYLIAKELATILLKKDFLMFNRKLEEIKLKKDTKNNIESILEKILHIYYVQLKNDVQFGYKKIEFIEKALQKLRKNANVDLVLDNLNIDFCFG